MTHRKREWTAITFVLAAILAFLVFVAGRSRLPHSGHKEPPSGDIVCLTEQNQYPAGTKEIAIQVENRGGYLGELNKPYLEVKRSNRWYILPQNVQEPETANLLSVHPGEPQTWHIYLTGYDLTLGEYRAVFDYWSGDGYFAFPFEIITEK